jgi:ABC-type nitrate/sulfonate/bicarbonate transport system substrate-binding protein
MKNTRQKRAISRLYAIIGMFIVAVAAIAGTYIVVTMLMPESETVKGTIRYSQNFPPDLADAWSPVIQDIIYDRYGYEYEVNWMESDQTNFQVLVSGQADLARLAGPYGFIAIENGAPLKMVTPMAMGAEDYVIMTHNISSWEGLAGKKIAISSFGSMEVLWFAYGLEEVGLSLSDVEMLPGGGSGARTAAVASGQFDAAAVHLVQYDGVKDEYPVVNLGLVNDFYPSGIWTGTWTTDAFIERHPQRVKDWVKCWVTAVDMLYDPGTGKQLFTEMAARLLPEMPTQEQIDEVYEQMTAPTIGYPRIRNLNLTQVVDDQLELMYLGDMTETRLTVEQCFPAELIDEALQELANES